VPQVEPAALSGPALLRAITDAMVALHLRYYHRSPTSAKTQLLGDDLLACTLTGIFTDVEKTMIELERDGVVKDTRRRFQQAIDHKFVGEVERLSGRTVTSHASYLHIGPDLAVEVFLLAPDP
jgi:uncharacterized protein YbcI